MHPASYLVITIWLLNRLVLRKIIYCMCVVLGGVFLCITVTSNIKSFFYTAYCSKKIFAGGRDSIHETLRHWCQTVRHFGTGAEQSGHFGTTLMAPKCLGSKVFWVRSVLTSPPFFSKSELCSSDQDPFIAGVNGRDY